MTLDELIVELLRLRARGTPGKTEVKTYDRFTVDYFPVEEVRESPGKQKVDPKFVAIN